MQKQEDTNSLDEFLDSYMNILRYALAYGEPKIIKREGVSPHESMTKREYRKFISACHSGYDKAQNFIVAKIKEIESSDKYNSLQKDYIILLLRKIIDAIIYTFFQEKTHLIRRFVLHRNIPNINLKDVDRLLPVVNKWNRSSRMTFSALCDLSTFMHVGDIITIDLEAKRKIKLSEAKHGEQNIMLSNLLEGFEESERTLDAIKKCKVIPEKFKKQAARMMRQKIRLSQVAEVLNTEAGVDIKTQQNINFSVYESRVDHFDDFLEELCEKSFFCNSACGTLDNCLHIFTGYSTNTFSSKKRCINMIPYVLSKTREIQQYLPAIDDSLQKFCKPQELFRLVDPFNSNLHASACRPFLIWSLPKDIIKELISGNLSVIFVLDTSAFIYQAKSQGLDITFSSKKEYDKTIKIMGCDEVVSWGNRLMQYKVDEASFTLLGGTFSRIINDLTSPKSIFNTQITQARPIVEKFKKKKI